MDKQELIEQIKLFLPDWNRNRVKALRYILELLVVESVTQSQLLEILQDLELDQDNRVKILKAGVTSNTENLLEQVVFRINNLIDNDTNYKLVLAQELPVVSIVLVYEDNLAEEIFYWLEGKGKGEYGQNGNIVISTENLVEISRRKIQASDDLTNGPNTTFIDLGEIPDGNYLSIINAYVPPLEITDALVNWFFEYTVNGNRTLLAFVGELGIYGLNAVIPMQISDLRLVYQEQGLIENHRKLITVNGNQFELVKNPNNIGNILESNDSIVNGYWGPTEFIFLARYLGGDINDKTNWQILSNIEEIPIN